MEFKDYYKVMNLSSNASQAEIKRAYRKLARKFHPDVSHEKNAEAKFKELGEAYEVLKDPKKRAQYDAVKQQGWQNNKGYQAPPHSQHGFTSRMDESAGFSDFFETLFGQGANTRSQRGFHQPSARGEDVYYLLDITLEDSYAGASRKIQIPMNEITSMGEISQKLRTINVKIPKGIISGQQIRLKGQGGASLVKGQPGDLYLEIRIKSNKPYDVDGKNVTLYLPISPWEAALGAKVKTPSLGGLVEIKVPPNSQTGTKLRLKGRGLPGDPPGDQYIILQIVVPPVTSEIAKQLYEQMEKQIIFNPRESLEV